MALADVVNGGFILADDIKLALQPPSVRVRQTAAQTYGTSGTFAALAFDTEDDDSLGNQHDNVTNNSRFTCQVAGKYQLAGAASFAANATGRRFLRWHKNGTLLNGSMSSQPANAAVTPFNARLITVSLIVGDYIELWAMQESGGSLATFVTNAEYHPSMDVRWVSF